MKYSRSAITQLNKWYKKVLVKCALFNAALFVSVIGGTVNAEAAAPTPTNGDDAAYTWKTSGANTAISVSDGETNYNVDIKKTTYNNGTEDKDLSYLWDNDAHSFTVSGIAGAVKTDGVEYVGNSASNGAALNNPDSASGWFISNTAANYGGAIYNTGTMSTIQGYFIANNANHINYGGGAIYNSGNIITITSDFIGNFATRYGGAIYNTGTISNTTGDFIGNHAQYGGAITNFGTMTNISGNFINNGGGEYNYYSSIYNRGTIENLNANFIGNAVNTTNSSDATVYNQGTITTITGDFIGNHGNVIRNYSDDWNLYYARVDSIDANFIDNTGTAIMNGGREATVQMGSINGTFQNNGRGIYLGATTITGDITGTFKNNGVITDYFYGGAIYADSVNVNSISGSFTGNKSSQGGAIFNYSYYGTNYITSLSGTFSENEANTGGAINNLYATITSLSGTFTNNSATQAGGAIYNGQKGLINISNSTFTGNSADMYGGAIYNFVSSNNSHPTVNIVDSSFTGNISPIGAAIYSNANTGSYQCTNNCAAIVKITAQNDNIVFTNNNSTGTAEGTGYGIWIGNGTFELNANSNKTITVNDAVYSRPVINVNTDENYNEGTVAFNNVLHGYYEGPSINIGGGTLKLGQVAADNTEDYRYGTFTFTNTPVLDLQNDSADTTYIDEISGNATLKIDVNVTSTSQSADKIVLDHSSSGTLTIDSLNMIGDANPDAFTVDIMSGSASYLSGITLNLSDDLVAQYSGTPTVENYEIPYVYNNYITFDTTDFTTEKWSHTVQKQLSINDYEVNYWTRTKQLKLDVSVTPGSETHLQEQDVSYDALQVLNQHEGYRTLTANGATATSYTVSDNLGAVASGTLNVTGVVSGNEKSTLDMNLKTGFELCNADTLLYLTNLNITNINDTADGGLINITGENSSAILSGVTIEDTTHSAIINDGELYLSGTNNLGTGITGDGNAMVSVGTATVGSIAQNLITIVSNGKLVANGDVTTGTGVNQGISNNVSEGLTINGGTLTGNVTGTGSVKTSGVSVIADGSTVSQAINVTGGTLTTNAAGLGAAVTNAGNIYLTGGTLAYNISGNGGSVTISGDVQNDADILNDITIDAGKSLTTSANNIGGSVANNGSYNITGGTIAGNITGTGDTSLSGAVDLDDGISIAQSTISNAGTLNADATKLTVTDTSTGITNTGTLNLTGATNANMITGSGTTAFAEDIVNTAVITQGTITVADESTLTSNADLTVSDVLSGNITGTGSVIIDGDVNANNAVVSNDITINANKALTGNADNLTGIIINGGTYNVTGGTITNAVTGGTLNVTGDVVVNTNGVNVATTTVDAGKSLNIGTNSVSLGTATINGTVEMEITSIAEDSDTYTGGKLNATNLTLGEDSKLSLTIAPNLIAKKTSTDALDLVNAATTTGSFAEITANNRYKFETDDDGKITITNFASVADIVAEGGGSINNVAGGEVWDTLVPQSAVATAVQNRLNYLSQHDAGEYVSALNNLTPTDSMTMVGVTQDLNNLIGAEVEARLDKQGMNSGDMFEKRGAWVQTLYNHSKQNDTDNIQGFTGDTFGMALGLDGDVNDNVTLGLGYAYSYTDVSASGRDTDINGHTFYVYGKYQPDAWYVRGMLNYGFAKYKEKADIGGIINHAEYDVENYGARAYLGYDLPNGFTSETGLKITHIKRGSYTDSVGQHVKTDGIDVLTASAGLNYSTTVETKGKKWTPKAHIAFTYDLLSDNTNATVDVAGGVYDIKGKKLNRFGVETGLGAEINLGQWDLSAEYDFGIRKNYISHTGMLKAKYNF